MACLVKPHFCALCLSETNTLVIPALVQEPKKKKSGPINIEVRQLWEVYHQAINETPVLYCSSEKLQRHWMHLFLSCCKNTAFLAINFFFTFLSLLHFNDSTMEGLSFE